MAQKKDIIEETTEFRLLRILLNNMKPIDPVNLVSFFIIFNLSNIIM